MPPDTVFRMAAMAPPDRHEDKWAALFRPPAAEHTTGVTEDKAAEDKAAEDKAAEELAAEDTTKDVDVEQKHKKPPVWQYLTAVAAVFAVALLFMYNSMPTDPPQETANPATMPAENVVADEPPPDTRLKLDPDVRQAVITQLTKAGGQPSRPVINFNFASDPSTGKAADVLSTANWMAGVRARTPPPEPPVH
jgi:hypothetical protein